MSTDLRTDPVSYNAWLLSRAWASTAIAQGRDKDYPQLYRTTLLEIFREGVRLVSTDSFVLLKAWVPNVGHPDAPQPTIDELPEAVAICADRDHRLLGLHKYAQKLTAKDGDSTEVTLTLSIGASSEPTPQATLEGLQQSSVRCHLADAYDESVESPVFDGAFPNWRRLWDSWTWEPTQSIGFGAEGILRLGKLSALWGKAAIEFHLGGPKGVARVEVVAPDVNVEGLAMPVRLRDEVPASPEGEASEFAAGIDEFLNEVLAGKIGGTDDEDDGLPPEPGDDDQPDPDD